MKILLTADWHLKPKHPFTRMINGKVWDRMCEEKLATLKLIPGIAKKYKVDVVAIVGDVFDTSNPPEALKAEFVKLLWEFKKIGKEVIVTTGRPGDHDYISPNNYVLMDIKEAFENEDWINISDKNTFEHNQLNGVLFYHDLLDGIDDRYKKTVPLDDEMFQKYNTILMGDYHSFYHKPFGKKNFIYPGTPYPTRYGESDHNVAIVDVDSGGKLKALKKVKLPAYYLLELTSADDILDGSAIGGSYVVKYKIVCDSSERSVIIRQLDKLKREEYVDDVNNMDVIWEVKSAASDSSQLEYGNLSLTEICKEYIDKNAPTSLKKSIGKIFDKLEKGAS